MKALSDFYRDAFFLFREKETATNLDHKQGDDSMTEENTLWCTWYTIVRSYRSSLKEDDGPL